MILYEILLWPSPVPPPRPGLSGAIGIFLACLVASTSEGDPAEKVLQKPGQILEKTFLSSSVMGVACLDEILLPAKMSCILFLWSLLCAFLAILGLVSSAWLQNLL